MKNRFSLQYVQWLFRNLYKNTLLKLGLKHTNDRIRFFMEENPRFKNAGNERHWLILHSDGNRKGFLWFKHVLGGWRIMLDSDKKNEWEDRGPIDSIRKLKSFL